MSDVSDSLNAVMTSLGLDLSLLRGSDLSVHSPIDGSELACLSVADKAQVSSALSAAQRAFQQWRQLPAPVRGEVVRHFAQALRTHKTALGALVTLEAGKVASEGQGEVQEMIDVCDFAVGLSRQLYGLTMASERPGHRMMETWHPLGIVGVISAFNFPVAVWCWNAALALVCGNVVVWKPSEKTPLCALACQAIFRQALQTCRAQGIAVPEDVLQVVLGARDTGMALVDDPRVALVSATGSTRMGREVAPRVAQRFGKSLLELGGNNAVIVAPSADLALALRGIVFAAAGTAGQRCTTTRRLLVHVDVYESLVSSLKQAYQGLSVGSPLGEGHLVGPLIDEAAYDAMQKALSTARSQGGVVWGGERVEVPGARGGFYVRPALVEMPSQTELVKEETFAPILYVMHYSELDQAIALNNDVGQGLSSAIFTRNLQEAERFMSAQGSDCGIANVNIGTSGAEIGGAFGGEKQTGGGRESGSDAWRAYMRRATNTVNYSDALPLAQGVRFDL